FFASCEGDVRFTTDQPGGQPALKTVPSELIGDYVNNDDSLYIRATEMTLVRPSRQTIPLKDSAKVGMTKTKDGRYIMRAGAQRYVENVSADSAVIVNRNADVYHLGKDTLLKDFNGCYWLSMKSGENEWKIMQITLHKKKLGIAVPSLPKDERSKMNKRLDEAKCSVDSAGVFSCVTPFTRSSDQSYFIVSATPDQLKNLDRRGLFRPVATFDKVK
ncbi:MAG TPA: hypothetical protein VFU15_13580, partial [Bacteroidia bacterium]|nr:hypothetical protein [Bacteroidia bacterium]